LVWRTASADYICAVDAIDTGSDSAQQDLRNFLRSLSRPSLCVTV